MLTPKEHCGATMHAHVNIINPADEIVHTVQLPHTHAGGDQPG